MVLQSSPSTALTYEVLVGASGTIELSVPFSTGSRVLVVVIREEDAPDDLAYAAESSVGFWDNSFDDEDWNAP